MFHFLLLYLWISFSHEDERPAVSTRVTAHVKQTNNRFILLNNFGLLLVNRNTPEITMHEEVIVWKLNRFFRSKEILCNSKWDNFPLLCFLNSKSIGQKRAEIYMLFTAWNRFTAFDCQWIYAYQEELSWKLKRLTRKVYQEQRLFISSSATPSGKVALYSLIKIKFVKFRVI